MKVRGVYVDLGIFLQNFSEGGGNQDFLKLRGVTWE